MPRKYTRKQLRKPDEFITLTMRFWSFVQSRVPAVLVTLGVASALVAAVWTWSYFADRRGTRATEAMNRALEIFHQTVVPSTEKAPPSEDGIPRFSSRADKLKAAEEEFTKLVDRGGPLAAQARLMRAAVRYEAGRYAEAITDYRQSLDRISDPDVRFRVLENLGYCHEGQKELDRALEAFRKLPREGAQQYVALFHEARILAKKKQKKEAVQLLSQIMEKASSTALQEQAGNQLALLEDR